MKRLLLTLWCVLCMTVAAHAQITIENVTGSSGGSSNNPMFTGQVELDNGSAAAPALVFTSETGKDTGFYFGGQGTFFFSSNGTAAMRFTAGFDLVANGRVGWSSTAAPDGTRDVELTRAGAGQLQIAPATGANLVVRAGSPTVGNVGANSCGTTAATIVGNNSGGRVTVGATSGTACRVTFSAAWANAPTCVANNETTGNLARATNATTTTMDIVGTFVAADTLAFVCVGF